jgi:hypothetical protein
MLISAWVWRMLYRENIRPLTQLKIRAGRVERLAGVGQSRHEPPSKRSPG